MGDVDALKVMEAMFGPGLDNVSIQACPDQDGTQIIYANAGVGTKGVLFKTLTAEADVSLIHMLQSKELPIQQVDAHILNASVSASVGLTYVGVDASLNLVKLDVSAFAATIGIGIDTEVGIKDDSVTVHVLGTGLTIGRKVGVSVLGSSFEVDFGKFWP